MTQLLDDLKAVRELLSVPERWTKDSMARAADGKDIDYASRKARCWCLYGAATKVTNHELIRGRDLRDVIRNHIGGPGVTIMTWNDAPGRTHADVLALLDRAIAAEEARS